MVKALGGGLAAMMVGIINNAPSKELPTIFWIAFVAVLAGDLVGGDFLSPFVAGITFDLLSEWGARVQKCPTTVYLPCVLVPFVPGRLMYFMMSEFVQGDIGMAMAHLVQILTVAGALGLALLVAQTIMKAFRRIR